MVHGSSLSSYRLYGVKDGADKWKAAEVYIIGEDQEHSKGGIIDNSYKASGVHSSPKCGVIIDNDKTTDVNCVCVLMILCFVDNHSYMCTGTYITLPQRRCQLAWRSK